MSESEAVKRQPEQQPAHVGGCVSAHPVEHQIEEVKQDEFNGMNGVCCK
jgi:hypothetical protein